MQKKRLIPAILWLLLSAIYLSSVSAQTVQQAGVVVDFGNGRFQTACVTFSEPQISGLELLQRANLPLAISQQAGGALVCGIDGVGCPADNCFCACQGGNNCQFWNYAHGQPAGWQFSAVGAAQHPIRHGDIDGWTWGSNASLPAITPPSLAEICGLAKSYLPLLQKS